MSGRPRDATFSDLLVLVPMLGAPLVHAPVLRFDLLRRLKRPIDGGATFRGRRIFGDNKTWRGALVMVAGTLGAATVLRRWPAYRLRLPAEIRSAPAPLVGALLGVGVVIGELPNSFLKRQLGVAPGQRSRGPLGLVLSVYDQADFVPVTALLLRPLRRMPARSVAAQAAAVAVVHVGINLVGYAIGARAEPL